MHISINAVSSFKGSGFKAKQKKPDTVVVLGSAKSSNAIMDYMQMCSDVTKAIVLSGNNVLHGCGKYGIMGSTYKSALENSTKDRAGKPRQNLAIIKNPLYGDEDLENCVIKGVASSEAERIEMFLGAADKILIFPGGATTIQEIVTLIAENNHTPISQRKKIVLIGKDYFDGLIKQYDKLYESGLLNDKPENLFTVANSEEEILGLLN